ncbi:MAG: protein-L-isoaspartate(D-aspartate) O-methyltransferase [Actinomycetota bacterium]
MPRTHDGLVHAVERSGLRDQRIVEAFKRVPRAEFVPEALRREAYGDRPVPIPEGQTTSQPTLIAHMIDAAAPQPDDRVLEVGSGYGFQTALLAQLAARVVAVERWPALVDAASRNLERNGITGASVYLGDGWKGWPDEAPYDAIVVSAAADELPTVLVEQLAEGGRLVVPLKRGGSDDVVLYLKRKGEVELVRLVTPARFVPLVREEER